MSLLIKLIYIFLTCCAFVIAEDNTITLGFLQLPKFDLQNLGAARIYLQPFNNDDQQIATKTISKELNKRTRLRIISNKTSNYPYSLSGSLLTTDYPQPQLRLKVWLNNQANKSLYKFDQKIKTNNNKNAALQGLIGALLSDWFLSKQSTRAVFDIQNSTELRQIYRLTVAGKLSIAFQRLHQFKTNCERKLYANPNDQAWIKYYTATLYNLGLLNEKANRLEKSLGLYQLSSRHASTRQLSTINSATNRIQQRIKQWPIILESLKQSR